jgi:hypothetical protein
MTFSIMLLAAILGGSGAQPAVDEETYRFDGTEPTITFNQKGGLDSRVVIAYMTKDGSGIRYSLSKDLGAA